MSAPLCYSTIQFSWGGTFDGRLADESPYDLIHLAPDQEEGGCGPILCGLDRHARVAADGRPAPGWSWRGGLVPEDLEFRPACPACVELRDPALVVIGVDAESFAAPWADHGSPQDPVWSRPRKGGDLRGAVVGDWR